MSTEIGRTDYGMTAKGAVTLITFEDNDLTDPASQAKVNRYQVRHGVRTIGDFSEKGPAVRAAQALAQSN